MNTQNLINMLIKRCSLGKITCSQDSQKVYEHVSIILGQFREELRCGPFCLSKKGLFRKGNLVSRKDKPIFGEETQVPRNEYLALGKNWSFSVLLIQ